MIYNKIHKCLLMLIGFFILNGCAQPIKRDKLLPWTEDTSLPLARMNHFNAGNLGGIE